MTTTARYLPHLGPDSLACSPAAGSAQPGAGRPAISRGASGNAGLSRSVSLAIALGLHVVVLYVVLRGAEPVVAPAVSVPLTISFATASEPMPAAAPTPAPPEPKPRPHQSLQPVPSPTAAHAPVPEPAMETQPEASAPPAPAETPSAQAAPPAVTPPRFDAAYLNNPVPAYPALSRRLAEQGRVLLRVYVRPDGSAREVHVHASSGYARLDRAAKDAVEHWQFVPARRGDEPVGAWVLVPVSFTLKQG